SRVIGKSCVRDIEFEEMALIRRRRWKDFVHRIDDFSYIPCIPIYSLNHTLRIVVRPSASHVEYGSRSVIVREHHRIVIGTFEQELAFRAGGDSEFDPVTFSASNFVNARIAMLKEAE